MSLRLSAEPTPAQFHAAARALEVALHYLTLPRFRVVWFRACNLYGQAVDRGNEIEISLSVDRTPAQVFRTMLHELRHASDLRSGYSFPEDRDLLEERAVAFVTRVVARHGEWRVA